MKRDGIIIYVQQYEAIKDLSQSDKGLLLDAIFHYHITGEVMQELPPMVLMAFTFIRTSIDSNTRKYEAIVERNRENGKKGGRPRNPNNPSEPKKPTGLKKTQANPKNPSEPKKADTDTDTDTVKDTKTKTVSIDDLFSNENILLKPIVSEWIAYKKEIKDPYTTVRGMKAFVNELQKLSNNDPKVAKEITDRSMANNWKGIYELNNNFNNNGNGKTATTTSRARQKLD